MLFTDGDCVTQADLQSIDSEVGSVATAQSLTISGDNSIIRRAIEEAGEEIVAKCQSFGGYFVGSGLSSNHVAAVRNTGWGSISSPAFRLNQVVVTEPDPTKTFFKRWLMYSALHDLYKAVVMRKMDDRFENKMNIYEAEMRRAWSNIMASGIPVIVSPLACPGAIREYNAGTWAAANITQITGSVEPGTTYDVAISWTAAPYVSPAVKLNGESATSARVSVSVLANRFLRISIVGLNPPGAYPEIGTSQGLFSPMRATGWNIYVGASGGILYLQNSTPIPVATTTYDFTAPPVLSGNAATAGQYSDQNYAFQAMLQRA